MNRYQCQVAHADGKRVSFERTAVSEAVVIRDLSSEGYFILGIQEVGSLRSSTATKLSPASVVKFTEILATLMQNGLTLKDALALAKPLGGKDLGLFLAQLDAQVNKGTSLHQALSAVGRGFSPLYLGLVRIGESTGDLGAIFPRLVEFLKADKAIRDKTISALVYPVFVLTVALVGIALLSLFVLPTLTESIGGVNRQIALSYQSNVASFQFGTALVFTIITLVVGAFVGLRLAARSSAKVALTFDSWILRLPMAGTLVWQLFSLNVSFALEILLSSGFSLEAALKESASIISNRSLGASWSRVQESVVRGSTLSAALRLENRYPQTFCGWVEVGEAAHDLKRCFAQLRTYYQHELDVLSTRFSNLAEPVLIVLVGILIILLVLTFITPIFTMLGSLF